MIINRHYIKTPTEIITTTLGIPEDYKQQCIQEAYKIGDSIDREKNYTNVKASMSSYEVWNETNVYNTLMGKIMETGKSILEEHYPSVRMNLKLTHMWTAIYEKGHYTKSHAHLPAILSFVYYLKADRNSSPLVFDHSDFDIYPYDDLLVMFPGYLYHSVPEHKGEDRICVAGNFDHRV